MSARSPLITDVHYAKSVKPSKGSFKDPSLSAEPFAQPAPVGTQSGNPTPAQECKPLKGIISALLADATSFDVNNDYGIIVD